MSIFSSNDERQRKQALEAEILAYRRLETLGMTDEFKAYADLLFKTVADKMIYVFTSDKITTWDDYCRVRGEIIARLQPLQATTEAGALANHLQQQLKEYYGGDSQQTS